jgi:hypothetical protein
MTDHRGIGTLINDETEMTSHGLDVFTVPPVENILKEGKTVYYYPINSVDTKGPFEFVIPKDPDTYTYLPYTRLEGEITLVKSDGTALAATDNINVVNLFPQSLFKQVECEINGTQVCDLSTPTYAWKSFIETHLTYGNSAKDHQLFTSLYKKDTIDKEEDFTANNGAKERTSHLLNKTFYFSNVIHSDFFHCQRYLIPNTELKVKFIRNENAFSLLAAADTILPKLTISNLRLSVRKIMVDPLYKAAQDKKIQTHPAIYPLTQSKIKTFQIPTGTSSIEIPSIIQGNLPRSIIIAFVNSNAFNSNINGNPFFFANHGINSFNLKKNGSPIVPTTFQPDFSTNNYMREYRWFLDNCGIAHENDGNDISFQEFGKNSNFWCFDLTPDLCNSFHLHETKQGNLDVNIGFKTALTTAIHMLVYASFNSAIAIDVDRNVKLIE